MNLKGIYVRWNSINLVIRIGCGLVIGLILGVLFPSLPFVSVLGDLFIGALKTIAPVLVFFLMIAALCNSKPGKGKHFRSIIAVYLIVSLTASALAIFFALTFPITVCLPGDVPSEGSVMSADILIGNLLMKMVENPISAMVTSNFLGVLFWGVIIGVILKKIGTERVKGAFSSISDLILKAVGIIISFAPFGILGITYSVVATNGVGIFADYAKLIALLVGCMLIMAFLVFPAIVAYLTRQNPYPLLFNCIKKSAVTAFFTRSSAVNIPMNLKLCEEENVDREFYSVSIPLGATINMSGAAITITIMTMVLVNSAGMSFEPLPLLLLMFVSTIAACGASGVSGGSLLMIPLASSLFGIPADLAMQMVAIGLIIGVIQDSMETALNSSSDALFTIATDRYIKRKEVPADQSKPISSATES